ncbi:MerR family transcriptional regulator [Streptomyces sp. NPDC054796]
MRGRHVAQVLDEQDVARPVVVDRHRLLRPERAPSGYKRYDVRHLVRLMGIRRLTDLGVPLSDTPTVAAADARSKEIPRALDAELAANIERQQHMRRQLAAILEDGASLGLPACFGAAATLPQAQQDLLVASSSVLTPTAMSLIRDQYTRPGTRWTRSSSTCRPTPPRTCAADWRPTWRRGPGPARGPDRPHGPGRRVPPQREAHPVRRPPVRGGVLQRGPARRRAPPARPPPERGG